MSNDKAPDRSESGKIKANSGHGHVWARPDGLMVRCGGPAMCKECQNDYFVFHQKTYIKETAAQQTSTAIFSAAPLQKGVVQGGIAVSAAPTPETDAFIKELENQLGDGPPCISDAAIDVAVRLRLVSLAHELESELTAVREQLAAANKRADSFREAVIDRLTVQCIYNKEHDTNPRKAVADMLAYEVAMTLDPTVSQDAQKLVDEARAVAVEDFIAWSVATYDELIEGDEKEIRALATLPSGFVVVPVEPTDDEVNAAVRAYVQAGKRGLDLLGAMKDAMIAARAK